MNGEPAPEVGTRATRAQAEAAITAHELGHCALTPAFWRLPEAAEALRTADVGAIVRILRRGTRLTQDQIARMSGLSQASISALESGTRGLRDARRIREVFDRLGAPLPAQLAHQDAWVRPRTSRSAPPQVTPPALNGTILAVIVQRPNGTVETVPVTDPPPTPPAPERGTEEQE